LTTWTPHALESEARANARVLWRVVEAQHTASTMRLTESLEEQAALEAVLEESKPALPPNVRSLHYLLATPFRYRPHSGSRFRAPFERATVPCGRIARAIPARRNSPRWRAPRTPTHPLSVGARSGGVRAWPATR